MNKQQIIAVIEEKYTALTDWLNEKGDEYWEYGPSGKWTTGQHIVHLTQSLKPLIRALKIPKFILKYKFGAANRPLKSYEQVVDRYHQKLEADKNVVSPFSNKMPNPGLGEKDQWIKLLHEQNNALINIIEKKWNSKNLDTYLLPHPLMGRMFISEILMWTAYHTEHHHKLIEVRSHQKNN